MCLCAPAPNDGDPMWEWSDLPHSSESDSLRREKKEATPPTENGR